MSEQPLTGPALEVAATRSEAEQYMTQVGGDPALLLAALIRLIADFDLHMYALRNEAMKGGDPLPIGEALAIGTAKTAAVAQVFAEQLVKRGGNLIASAPIFGGQQAPTPPAPTPPSTVDAEMVGVDGEFKQMAAYANAENVVDETGMTAHDIATTINKITTDTLNTLTQTEEADASQIPRETVLALKVSLTQQQLERVHALSEVYLDRLQTDGKNGAQ